MLPTTILDSARQCPDTFLGTACIRDAPDHALLPCVLLDTVASLGQIHRGRSQKDTSEKGSSESGDVCNQILEKELLKRFSLLRL